MKRIIVVSIVSILALSLTSCGMGANYLTQNKDYTTTNKEREQISKIKVSLLKPIISYDKQIEKKVGQIDAEGVIGNINEVSLGSYFSLVVDKVIHEAESYIGTPYRFGGTTRGGIDCSAFMQRIYETEGIELPRISSSQAKIGYPVEKQALQKGDLVFFSTTSRGRVTHVGMVYDVSEEGKISFIHASSSRGVTISDLDDSYWSRRYRLARRIEAFASAQLVKNAAKTTADGI